MKKLEAINTNDSTTKVIQTKTFGDVTATATRTATASHTPANGNSTGSSSSYVLKCLLKTVRFMWQVTAIPMKIGETIGSLYRYAQDSVDSFLCVAGKARRKERDGDQNSTDTKLYLEESVLERKLPEADLKALVDLPAGLDYNEWLASHTLALFEHVNLVYGTISEFCTPSGCSDMTGPANRTYLWFDEKGKKTRVAAPQYIDYVMTFTQKTVSDESIFPTKYANEFPSSFEMIARKILRLQFHVIAHLYAAHFREIALLGLHTHLNLTFAHLTALHRRFNLIDEKETDVLRDLEVALRLTDNASNSSNTAQTQQQQPQQQNDMNSITAIATSATTGIPLLNNTSLNESSAHSMEKQQQQQHQNNSQQEQHSVVNSISATTLIDGDAAAPPICTQPEPGVGKQQTTASAIFGLGGSNLMGGILGDLTTGEFGDTTRYCTSAVPLHSAATTAAGDTSITTTASTATTATTQNGAGALHLNFRNNNNNYHHHLNHHVNHHHHNHYHHHALHGGHLPHVHPHNQQNSGLIQCNAIGAATNTVASANNSSTTTTTA